MARLALFASGGGSNVQAIVDYAARARAVARHAALGAVLDPVLVVTDRNDAGVLARAAASGLRAHILEDHRDGSGIRALLESEGIDLIALAGYLKFVPTEVTARWRGAIVNVHPSLLPRFGGPGMYGARVHAAVLAAGERESGATVHFVDDVYDRGAIIGRARVPVVAGDTPSALAERVLTAEHALFPRALHAVALGLVSLDARGVARGPRDLADHPALLPSPVALEFACTPLEHGASAPSVDTSPR